MRTRTANMRVRWAGDMLPPDVYVGHNVCGAGKLKTRDGGQHFFIVDAVPIPGGRAAMKLLAPLLDDICADPTDWCPDLLDERKPPRY